MEIMNFIWNCMDLWIFVWNLTLSMELCIDLYGYMFVGCGL